MSDKKLQSIGRQIRHRRKELGLSLRELAEKTDLTAGFLGQVERGESSPSIDTFLRIADALEAPVNYFLWNEHEQTLNPSTVTDDNISRQRLADPDVKFELLSRDFGRKMEFFRARIKPGASRVARPLREPTEQIIYVLSGVLSVTLDTGEHILQNDHFLYFNGASLRRIASLSDEDTVWISVITPPVSS